MLLTVSMLLYSSESLCLWFWANACLYTPLSLLNNIHIFVILLSKQVCSFISISCKEKCFSVSSCSSFYLSSVAPHSLCSLAFDTSPHVSVPPAQRQREVPETPDTVHSQKAICGKYISVVPWAVLLSFALWWSEWSYCGLLTMVIYWVKLNIKILLYSS